MGSSNGTLANVDDKVLALVFRAIFLENIAAVRCCCRRACSISLASYLLSVFESSVTQDARHQTLLNKFCGHDAVWPIDLLPTLLPAQGVDLGGDAARAVLGQSLLLAAARRGRADTVSTLLAASQAIHIDGATSIRLDHQPGTAEQLSGLKIGELREALFKRRLDASGTKPELEARLLAAFATDYALSVAVTHGHAGVVRVLIDAGASTTAPSEPPLTIAARSGHASIVKILITAGAAIEALDSQGETALLAAAGNGYEDVMRHLVAAKADMRAADHDGSSALMIAAAMGRLDIVEIVLASQSGRDAIDAVNAVGESALLIATEMCDVEGDRYSAVVATLIRRRADVQLQDQDGETALSLACGGGRIGVVSSLLSASASVNHANQRGCTALFAAAAMGHASVLVRLIAAAGDANLGADRGQAPLFIGAQNGHATVVRALLRASADVDCEDTSGQTPLSIAMALGHAEVLRCLNVPKNTST